MADNKQAYAKRLKRFEDVMAVREPDRVPCVPCPQTYPYLHAGYTMADVMYDDAKAQDGIRKYLTEYEPDLGFTYANIFCGLGHAFEVSGVKFLRWAGEPGVSISENSVHQFIEEEFMTDDEYPELLADPEAYIRKKWMTRAFPKMGSLASFDFTNMLGYGFMTGMIPFANPELMDVFKSMQEVGGEVLGYIQRKAAFEHEIEDMGYPIMWGPLTLCAFDNLSDWMRGTLGSMMDVMTQPDNLKAAVEMFYPASFYGALAQKDITVGKTVFIPLNKGFDGFLSPEQYDEFYWPTLHRLILDLIEAGMIPYVYTEGKYDSRLETIADVPKGKVLFSFEDADMKEAKRIIGDHACITGGFNNRLLETGTVDEVRDEVKRVLDICAPGGGYIFGIRDTLDNCKPECVEAMFETVKECGKY